MDEERDTEFDKLADYVCKHTICVDGTDVHVIPLTQLRSIFSLLFPNLSSKEMSYEEIVDCVVKRLVYILLHKESPESFVFCIVYG